MKILQIGMSKIRYMPYVHFYLNKLDLAEHEVHMLCWSRDQEPDIPVDPRVTVHYFTAMQQDEVPLKQKIPNFLRYRRFMLKKLRELKPDFLIVHYSTAGVLLLDQLLTSYHKRYILDYRDVTYERIGLYKTLVAQVVHHAKLVFTSSDGFRPFLPDVPHLHTCHNVDFRLDPQQEAQLARLQQIHLPIRFAFWGMLRSYPLNRLLLEKLGNDPRFQLHFYGRAQGELLQLMEDAKTQYTNVCYHGIYHADDRVSFAAQTDLLHNLYEKTDKTAGIAMGNKYYDGFRFFLPQICMEESFMAQKAEKAGIGLTVDPEAEDFADRIYDWYLRLDRATFAANCDAEAARIQKEVEQAELLIDQALTS